MSPGMFGSRNSLVHAFSIIIHIQHKISLRLYAFWTYILSDAPPAMLFPSDISQKHIDATILMLHSYIIMSTFCYGLINYTCVSDIIAINGSHIC